MSEWWTYRPSDFLMFAPRIYWRLFESVNQAYAPCIVVIVAAVLVWAWRGERWRRTSGMGLAAAFALCAWVFLHQRFAPIFWLAEYYALAFAGHALLTLLLTAVAGATADARIMDSPLRRRAAVALALWAAIGHPLLAPLAGRPWTQAEWLGLAPDPTAILALAWLLRQADAAGWRRALQRAAWVIPLAWCSLSAATLATMGEWQALVMLAVPAVAVLAMKKGRSGEAPLRPN
jgi:hypothetical protein